MTDADAREIVERLRKLAKRRELEGNYTDTALVERAADIIAAALQETKEERPVKSAVAN